MSQKPLQISSQQRSILEKLSKSSKSQIAKRATIILALTEEGMTQRSVAKQLGTTRATVRRWRKRFEVGGIQGLHDVIRRGAPRRELMVSARERAELERFVQRFRINRNLAFRSRIILKSAQNLSNLEVARQLRCSTSTVTKWRKRFMEGGVDGLLDEARPGAERKISDDVVEEIIVKTLEKSPKGWTHWSTRKMAEQAGVSHSTVGRIWRTFGLKPHLVEGFKISDDPLFIEKVRDIVGLYLNPPDHAIVFSFDEKPQIQTLERAQPILPMDFGKPERQTHNYFRHGTLDLFAALDVVTGKIICRTRKQHRGKDFVAFLRVLDAEVESNLQIHVILDNLSAHKSPPVQRWLARHPRFHFHFTPTYASWLNLVERFFGLLTQRALKRGSFRTILELKTAIDEYIEVHNEEGQPFVWTKTADEILDNIKRFGQRTLKVHS